MGEEKGDTTYEYTLTDPPPHTHSETEATRQTVCVLTVHLLCVHVYECMYEAACT